VNFAVLCPGQGAQHAAMLDLINGDPAAEEVLAEGARVIGSHPREWLTRDDQMFANVVAQPLLCLTELATWAALRDRVGEPGAFAGYSVGELAAYACAGAMDASLLAGLARTRARLMDDAADRPGGLVAMRGLRRTDVETLCANNHVWIAIVNGEDAFVIGGETSALEGFVAAAGARGAQIVRLHVGVASHTPMLEAAVVPLQAALSESVFRAPATPVVAGVDASWVTARAPAIAKLAAQIATRLEWARCLDVLFERGCRLFLELGPGGALSRMARDRLGPEVEARSASEFRSLDTVAAWLRKRIGAFSTRY